MATESPAYVRFLAEALPLVATFFSGEDVELGGTEAEVGLQPTDEYQTFAAELRLRRSLAAANELMEIVRGIERATSSTGHTVRAESKGAIRGRLDIPMYVARQTRTSVWPRTYPIIITEDTPQTPENSLARKLMGDMARELSVSSLPFNTAEGRLARAVSRWLHQRVNNTPWNEISPSGPINRLAIETRRRIQRRQTGNHVAYSRLVTYVEKWSIDPSKWGDPVLAHDVATALLAFPVGEGFADRVFEIWCLQVIQRILNELLGQCVGPIVPLHRRGKEPVYQYVHQRKTIKVWFQRSFESKMAKWYYADSNQPLRGTPDVWITDGSRHLVIDAKNRLVRTNTRSEETYKLLGYFENFDSLLGLKKSAIICFISETAFKQQLTNQNASRIDLLAAHTTDEKLCSFSPDVRAVLADWLGIPVPQAQGNPRQVGD